jgi:hypothetical protein
MQPSKLHVLDICYLLFDYYGPGTMVVLVKKRKSDQWLQGLWPRIEARADYDVISMLQLWMLKTRRIMSRACEKQEHQHCSCLQSWWLFVRLLPVGCGWSCRSC